MESNFLFYKIILFLFNVIGKVEPNKQFRDQQNLARKVVGFGF